MEHLKLRFEELSELGWDERWQDAFASHVETGYDPGRVAAEHRGGYVAKTTEGDVRVKVPGKLLHDATGRADLPAVGDWVALERVGPGDAVVRGILPRRSKFSRKVAWVDTEEQIIAVNVDVVFIVSSLNSDLNLRRLERYLTLSWESGAMPVVVLTKSDLALDIEGAILDVSSVAPGVPIHAVSAVEDDGVDTLREYFEGAKTVALLGSSGTGKSTLINRLLGQDVQTVRDIRDDDKGRHTTTSRELIVMPGGGVVIDTPGMRELQLWDASDGVDGAFSDISELAVACRFRDCEHGTEPGCAVAAAVASGSLPAARLANFHKLQRELQHLARRQDQRAAANEKRKYKVRTKAMRRDGITKR